MTRDQIERAERAAKELERRSPAYRMRLTEAIAEAQQWKSPRSIATGAKTHTIATKRHQYTFTDEQFRIALASLDRSES